MQLLSFEKHRAQTCRSYSDQISSEIIQVHPSSHEGKPFCTCNDVLAKIAVLVAMTVVYLGCHEIPYRFWLFCL
jgi:hypothetical protein